MGQQQDLKTVSAGQSASPARRFETAEPKTGFGALAAGAAQFVIAAGLLKNFLWGQDQPTPDADGSDEFLDDHQTNLATDQPSVSIPVDDALDQGEAQAPPMVPEGFRLKHEESSSGAQQEPAEIQAVAFHLDPAGASGGFKPPVPTLVHDQHNLVGPSHDPSIAAHSASARMGTKVPLDVISPESDAPDADSLDVDSPDVGSSGVDPLELPINHAPVVASSVLLPEVALYQTIVFSIADLLENASDPDGDTLSVEEVFPSSGQVIEMGDGKWSFIPALDSAGVVSFNYFISDGTNQTTQTATLTVVQDHGHKPPCSGAGPNYEYMCDDDHDCFAFTQPSAFLPKHQRWDVSQDLRHGGKVGLGNMCANADNDGHLESRIDLQTGNPHGIHDQCAEWNRCRFDHEDGARHANARHGIDDCGNAQMAIDLLAHIELISCNSIYSSFGHPWLS